MGVHVLSNSIKEALGKAGYIPSYEGFYKLFKDIPMQMFSIPICNVVYSKRNGSLTIADVREDAQYKVNQIIREMKNKVGISEDFIKELYILESEKESIELRNLLLKYKDKVLLSNGYGCAIVYDSAELKYYVLQNHHTIAKQIPKSKIVPYLDELLGSGKIPFVCLKLNREYTGFKRPTDKPNYVLSAYGYNILRSDKCNKKLINWYKQFGTSSINPNTLYDICYYTGGKMTGWYLIKRKKGEL